AFGDQADGPNFPQHGARSRPSDFDYTAGQAHVDLVGELAPESAHCNGGCGARAACERLAHAARDHPEPDAPIALALHETDIDAAREARVALELRAQRAHRRTVH